MEAIGAPGPRPVEAVRFSTTDPDQAAALLERPFPGISFSAAGDGTSFSLAYERVSDGRMSVNRLGLTGSAVVAGSVEGGVGIARVCGGRFDLQYGRQTVDTSAPYLRPAGRSHADLRDVRLQLIELDPHAFAQAASARLEGTGRIVRLPSADATAPRAHGLIPFWHGIADLVMTVASDEAAFTSPIVRAGLFDLAVSGLLATFPITSEIGVALPHGSGSASVRRALTFIDENFASPIDVAAIAVAARLPVRTLHSRFRSQTGSTPMEHVRLRRLAAVRAELLEADPTSRASVAVIARRWGFAHPARFAGQYRRTYGEAPSDTLRR